jgi:2-polyprenyl-3-methyl-5-hydroxy-6-metoxy-1,4-benzoquinol methylase
MPQELVHPLDAAALKVFEMKGTQAHIPIPQKGNSNGLKVRRILQLLRDQVQGSFENFRMLDLACGEGVYSVEAALRGAEVLGVDARMDRMQDGADIGKRHGLSKLSFEQTDIRKITRESHGEFDAVLMLGILYHLDHKDIFPILQNIYGLCRRALIIDTHIALKGDQQVEYAGQAYRGHQVREHGDNDSEAQRKSRLLASLDNTFAFWFTKDALVQLLGNVGFTSVCECHVPFEADKPDNRITLLAIKGEPVKLSSYPWVNDKTEAEIQRFLGNGTALKNGPSGSRKGFANRLLNGALRPLGLEVRRLTGGPH